jgi:acyl-CoA ligase (AMP-forming) (exosortase A-associated)
MPEDMMKPVHKNENVSAVIHDKKRVVSDIILSARDACPDKTAALRRNNTITYAEACEGSVRLGGCLRDLGVVKGDRVCFYLEKMFEKIMSIFGICMAGGVFVPINRLSKLNQAVHILNDSGARVLITTANRIPPLMSVIQEIKGLEIIISIGSARDVEIPDHLSLIEWEEIMARGSGSMPRVHVTEHDLAAILYTSGSTGRPKGVVLNHLNIMAGTRKISEYLKITPDDRLLSILSFGFDYGLNQLTTAFGQCAQIVLLDYLFPRDIIRAVERYGITGLASVAATWIQLLQVPWEGTAMSSLRYVTNSGGAIPAHLVLELKRRLPDTEIFLMYGLTEAFRSTYLPPELVGRHPTSIGRAVPGEEIMVLDLNDRPVKPGETGELVHRGVLVSQGYWNDPELTRIRFRENPLQPAEVPLREMVVYSGDQVRIDEEGLLYFIGRWDEMIKCAGNRISPTEVEEVIYQYSGVADAVALGIPHETYGQSVLAVVSPTGSAALSVADILGYCREQMPSYMVPGELEIWESLPRNSNGKLDRSAIRKAVMGRKELRVAHE